MEGVRVSPVDSPLSTAQFDLTLSLTQTQTGDQRGAQLRHRAV